MIRRLIPMLLATLAVSAGAFAVPVAATETATLSPGCQRFNTNPFRDDVTTFNIQHEFYAGEVITLTVSDFQNGTDRATFDVVPYDSAGQLMPDYFGPGQFFERVGLTTTDPTTFTWTVPVTRTWGAAAAARGLGAISPTADFTYGCQPPAPELVLSAFEAPVDAALAINLAQAGRTIPFKFTATDSDGIPVTDLTAEDVTPVSDLSQAACETTAGLSVIESYASGAGDLTHLGDGRYIYTLKTDKAWHGTCGTLGVSVRGVEQTVDFQFRS